MGKVDAYRKMLRGLDDWEPFLLAESGLPGPRGNLELAQAVADEGDEAMFARWRAYDAQQAPVNSPYEFLAFCGTLGLGRLLAEGRMDVLPTLRACASDPRWRTREAVAMALQRWGRADMDALLMEMAQWATGNPYEQRAMVAGLCEPDLLRDPQQVARVLRLLDAVTASIVQAADRRNDAFIALRKGLGYGWSVAVCALPDVGKSLMEKWLASDDKDVRWIMNENLKKARLIRMDAEWVNSRR
ncbi:MAG TPA: hypothetical protein PKZ84_02600 [Anaerolineae bacterium]|nr:hypothetical protein [Anaerolineae bacterium]HQI85995.1 hypothetical protein [Anaerolineae bacterium]